MWAVLSRSAILTLLWCLLLTSCVTEVTVTHVLSVGIHAVWRRDQWQQGTAGGSNTYLCNTSTNHVFHWRESQPNEISVCCRCCQVTQEIWPVSCCQCLCTFVLVRKDTWHWWTRGQWIWHAVSETDLCSVRCDTVVWNGWCGFWVHTFSMSDFCIS